jgi:hypothetical protein
MTELVDTLSLVLRIAGGGLVLYGMVLALELDLLVESVLKRSRSTRAALANA